MSNIVDIIAVIDPVHLILNIKYAQTNRRRGLTLTSHRRVIKHLNNIAIILIVFAGDRCSLKTSHTAMHNRTDIIIIFVIMICVAGYP